MKLSIGAKEYIKGIKKIVYERKESDNPLAFKYYDAKRKVGKKTMEEHFREQGEPKQIRGKQEYFESLINQFLLKSKSARR